MRETDSPRGNVGAIPGCQTLLLTAGLLVAFVFVICGLYGLSGAGALRRLPLLRLGLIGIGAIYTLRGMAFVPQLLVVLGILPSAQAVPFEHLLSSGIALVVSLLYLLGLVQGWKYMSVRRAVATD